MSGCSSTKCQATIILPARPDGPHVRWQVSRKAGSITDGAGLAPLAACYAMMQATASRQLWSSLSTWQLAGHGGGPDLIDRKAWCGGCSMAVRDGTRQSALKPAILPR